MFVPTHSTQQMFGAVPLVWICNPDPLSIRIFNPLGSNELNRNSACGNKTATSSLSFLLMMIKNGIQDSVAFTGKGPRKGWRTPLNIINDSEQRDEEKERPRGPFASERGDEPRSGIPYCSVYSYTFFGARYMDHELMAMWLSVDPMADKYPNISPYNYCMWNPIKVIDPNGKDTIKTPTGISISVGDGYQATPDGKYLFGDGLVTKEWDPSLCQIVSDDGSPLGGYKNCELNNNAPWMQFAISQIGVKEVPMGENRGPAVEKYLRSTNSEAGNPWCASFVNWCLQQSGYSGAGA